MELDQALGNLLTHLEAVPREEIECVRQHKEEAIPKMLEFMQNFVRREDPFPVDYKEFKNPIFYMYLLAEFRIHEAFKLFIEVLKFDEDDYDYFIAEMSEDLVSMIASAASTSDVPILKEIIENTAIPGSRRRKALNVLLILYVQDIYSKEDFFSYLDYLLDKLYNEAAKAEAASEDDRYFYEFDDELLTEIVLYCTLVCNDRRIDLINKAIEEEKINTYFTQSYKLYEHAKTSADALNKLKGQHSPKRARFINDTIREIEWWASFNRKKPGKFNTEQSDVTNQNNAIIPEIKKNSPGKSNAIKKRPPEKKKPKIGKNDPCPCKSGKMYKNCCFKKAK